jgi:type IV secretory pathway VirJ component
MSRTVLLFVLAAASCANSSLLVESPARMPKDGRVPPYFAVLLTGDGGWRSIDVEIADELNAHGIPVVGFLSNRYFSQRRTAAEVARDVEEIIECYAKQWGTGRVLLIGYSRGADAVPLVLAGISPAQRARIVLAAMLGPARHAELEIRWLPFGTPPPSIDLLPVIQALHGAPRMLCINGEDDDETLCPALTAADARVLSMPGGHHFGGRYHELARTILQAAGR